ncbi:MAG: biopolymer transporter ExbD [Verrucomicrobiales bacterium]|nr:biopolymer transporter ExbD [Verrucomicrobiales bacterium]MED5586719.1 biopolymer transporter ExbD [Verrucomicrobiota bacterium]
MNFVRKRSSRPSVPIISLIDILAILLIYFILTSAPLEEKTFANITLPEASALSSKTTSESRMELAVSSDSRIFLGAEEVPAGELAANLRKLKEERPGVKLELKADEDAPLKALVAAWDALTRSGFKVKDVPARILLRKTDKDQ